MTWQMTFNNLVLPKTKQSHAYIHDWSIRSITALADTPTL